MKKISCVFLLVLALSFLYPAFALPVYAGGSEIIGQGVTLRRTPVYISDGRGWRVLGYVNANTPIAIYQLDADYVKNSPNQFIPRQNVGVYGVDRVRQTNWGKPLLSSTGPLLIGEVVFAGGNCKKMSGPGYGVDFNYAPEGTRMLVQNKSNGWLFVLVNGNPQEPCWVPEFGVRRGTTVADGYLDEFGNLFVLVGLPISNHLAGGGRAIAVTAEQAREAVQLALQGRAGVIYTRADGRVMIDITRNGFRYLAFLDADGQLGSFFPPAERHQVAGTISKAANYVENVIVKGGYWRIQAGEVSQQIKNLWLPVSVGSAFVQVLMTLANSETMFLMFFDIKGWNYWNITNPNPTTA